MACFHVGDDVWLHFHIAKVYGKITAVTVPAKTCAKTKFMVHEVHHTVDGKKLVHNKEHYGSALHHASKSAN